MSINTLTASPQMLMVRDFMQTADSVGVINQKVRDIPDIPTRTERVLCARLVLEDAFELVYGLGLEISFGEENRPIFTDAGCADLIEVADAGADLEYVLKGALARCGINNDGAIFRRVHENNMLKFALDASGEPKYSVSPEGKLVKPKDHKKVDLTDLVVI